MILISMSWGKTNKDIQTNTHTHLNIKGRLMYAVLEYGNELHQFKPNKWRKTMNEKTPNSIQYTCVKK